MMLHRCYLAASVVAAMTLLPTGLANAQCTDSKLLKTDCSVSECQTRQSKVHTTCDVSGGRTCTSGPQNKTEFQRRLKINQDCKAVRQAVADCYKVSDSGHQQQISDAQRSIDECNTRISNAK
jgi:hypothetical protein